MKAVEGERVLWQPFVVVGAIIEEDGKILLVLESGEKRFDAGKWNHPAGWVEHGEDPIEAIKREVWEETTRPFKPENILGVYSLVRSDLSKNMKYVPHAFKIIFSGSISKKPVCDRHNDVSGDKWFTPQQIYEMNKKTLRDLDIKMMVRHYFEGRKYPLDLLYHTVSTL